QAWRRPRRTDEDVNVRGERLKWQHVESEIAISYAARRQEHPRPRSAAPLPPRHRNRPPLESLPHANPPYFWNFYQNFWRFWTISEGSHRRMAEHGGRGAAGMA